MWTKIVATALGLLGIISQAQATVITFEKESGSYITIDGSTFKDGGYEFVFGTGGQSGGAFGPAALIGQPDVNIACSPPCSSDGTSSYYSNNGASLTMFKTDGLPFSLDSIYAAQVFTTLNFSLELNVTGQIKGGGTVTALFRTAPGGADTFATYTLPASFAELLSVEFVGDSHYPANEFALDNINVIAVPEPSIWAMMLIGFAGIGFAGYRRVREPRAAEV
jgi:hypothetical protein